MEILVVAGAAPDPALERLVDRLAQAHGVRVVRSEGEAELGRRSARTDLIIAAAGRAEPPRRPEGVPFAAWLPARSSERAAELLESGVDDVVDATMSLREQVARLEAVSRRMPVPAESVSFGPLRVDRGRGEATWHGRRLELTPRERDVLHVLADGQGAAVRREVLYRAVWGYAMARGDRTVDVNVTRLRAKLAAAVGAPLTIETEPAVGYRLRVSEPAVTAL